MAASSNPPSTTPPPTSPPTTNVPPSTTPPPRSRRSSSTGVQELSRLLLEGWTMLADTCPRAGCTMPLARSRAGRVVCCSCGLDVVQPGERPAPKPETTATPTATPDQPSASARVSTAPDASRAMVPAVSAPRGQRDAVSARLGEKLLQGWTLLDAGCVRCSLPLLRDGGGRVVCVGCQDAGPAHPPPADRDARQLMPHVMHVAANGEVGRVTPRAERPATATPAGATRAEPAALPPGVPLRVLRGVEAGGEPAVGEETEGEGEGHVDVDGELRLVEAEAGRKLRGLRRALARADDAERCRVVAAAAAEVALVVTRAREARAVGARLGGGGDRLA